MDSRQFMNHKVPLRSQFDIAFFAIIPLFAVFIGMIRYLKGMPMTPFDVQWCAFWLTLFPLRLLILGYWTRFYTQTFRVDDDGIALVQCDVEAARVPWEGMRIEWTLPLKNLTPGLRAVYLPVALFMGYCPPLFIRGSDKSCIEVPSWPGLLRRNPVLLAIAAHGPDGNALQSATRAVPTPDVPRTASPVPGQTEGGTPEPDSAFPFYVVGTPKNTLFPMRFIIGNYPLYYGLLSLLLLFVTSNFLPVSLVMIAIGLWISTKCVLILIASEKLPWLYNVTQEGIQRVHVDGQVTAYPWVSLVHATKARSGFIPSLLDLLCELALGPRPVKLTFSDGTKLVLPRAPRMSIYRSCLEDVRYHCAMMGPDDNLLYRACLEERRFCKLYRGRGSRELRALMISGSLPTSLVALAVLVIVMGGNLNPRAIPLVGVLLVMSVVMYFTLLKGGPLPRVWTQEDYRAQVRGGREAKANP
jgi:hypothetical protein